MLNLALMRVLFALTGLLAVALFWSMANINAQTAEIVGRKNWKAQIDEESWLELTFLFERVVDTLGVIAPVLELAKTKNADEKIGHLERSRTSQSGASTRSRHLDNDGLWYKRKTRTSAVGDMEDFADIFQAAHQIPSPNRPPNTVPAVSKVPRNQS